MIIKYSEEVYNWVKELSKPEKYSVRKVTLRAAIDLLATHIHHFREFVYHDYKYWNELLLKVAEDKNVQCSRCAQSGLRRFYREMGRMLNYKTSDDDKAVFMVSIINSLLSNSYFKLLITCIMFQYFISFFEERLKNDQHVNSNILCFIVYGFSQMAASCKKYRGNQAVKDMFSLIAHYALTLCSRYELYFIILDYKYLLTCNIL